MLNFIRRFLAFFFSSGCIMCHGSANNVNMRICSDCFEACMKQNKTKCIRCSTKIEVIYGDFLCKNCRKKRHFDKVISPFVYKDKVKKAVLNFKFHNKKSYAKTLAAAMFLELKAHNDICSDFDVITFVPQHIKRLGERGYNPAELLAEHLCELSGHNLANFLKCTRYEKPLSRRKHKNRADIIKGLYKAINPDEIKGKKVLICDDVITTGSTFSECAKILKKAGAEKVYGIAVAATPRV